MLVLVLRTFIIMTTTFGYNGQKRQADEPTARFVFTWCVTSAHASTCTAANHSLSDWDTLEITQRLTDWRQSRKKVTGQKKKGRVINVEWEAAGRRSERGVTAGGRYVGKKTQRGCGWFSLSANHRRDEPKRWLLATHNQSQNASFWLCHSLLCLAAHHSPCMCVSLSVSLLCYTASFILTANRLPMSFSGNNVLRVMCCVSSPFVYRLNCYTWYTLLWKLWNSLQSDIRNIDSLSLFKYTLKTHLFRTAYSLTAFHLILFAILLFYLSLVHLLCRFYLLLYCICFIL